MLLRKVEKHTNIETRIIIFVVFIVTCGIDIKTTMMNILVSFYNECFVYNKQTNIDIY